MFVSAAVAAVDMPMIELSEKRESRETSEATLAVGALPRSFHVVTVGWDEGMIAGLWEPAANRAGLRSSHILHPRRSREQYRDQDSRNFFFFRERESQVMPEPDLCLLSSLERDGVPTVHNMILGDRVVSKLASIDAYRYATFLATRLLRLFEQLKPDVVIGGFDALHGGMGLAVARFLRIPWYAPNFSVIPPGFACFCDRMSPAARVQITAPNEADVRARAESALKSFEQRRLKVPAYITPGEKTLLEACRDLPRRVRQLGSIVRNARRRKILAHTDNPASYNLRQVIGVRLRERAARRALSTVQMLKSPPKAPYVLFGLHTQPESSIDVWAPFFSNQQWVVELLARSMPPTHRLLVKIHKSDAAKYTEAELQQVRRWPNVEIVHPFADTRSFMDAADLIVAIQGTMGLEGALLGKPVIVLGDSPIVLFPSVCRAGALDDLPKLTQRQLARPRPSRDEIIDAFANYLSPFMPASHNDWTKQLSEQQVDNYSTMLRELREFLQITRNQSSGTF